ncbi:MAG: hypothetical protein ABJP70_11760 [Erythrobacter sp.]
MKKVIISGLAIFALSACGGGESDADDADGDSAAAEGDAGDGASKMASLTAQDIDPLIHCWASHRELSKIYSVLSEVVEDPTEKAAHAKTSEKEKAETEFYQLTVMTLSEELEIDPKEIDQKADDIGDPYGEMLKTMEMEEFSTTIARKTDECEATYPAG